MSNPLSTSRSCQKLLVSGTNSNVIRSALSQAALNTTSTVLPVTGGPSIQAEFVEPTVYTVEFRVSNVRDINVPAGNPPVLSPPKVGRITPTATIQYSLGGNTIYRKISVFSGASISGVCEQLVASVSDETILPITFQVGIYISVGSKTVLGVNTIATVNIVTNGLQTINGVSLVDGNTVLLTNQASAVDNGIYIVYAGAWIRLPNLGNGVHAGGSYTVVAQGTHAGEWWQCIEVNGTADVVGTDGLTFDFTLDPTYQQQYTLTIVGGEGTRASTALPPTYQQYIKESTGDQYLYGCIDVATAQNGFVQIPPDVGITSVMVTAGDTAQAGAITPTNFFVQMLALDGTSLKNYYPPDYEFVPVPSQAAQLKIFNKSSSPSFDMLVSIVWGIDG
jgi:hypothetical protein